MTLTSFPKTVICLALLMCGSCLAPMTAAQQSSRDWDFVSIIAPPQTVTVETPRGSYTAAFENDARVYPDGRARGVLELSGPDGTPHRFRVLAGRVRVDDDGTVTRAVLHLREVDPGGLRRLNLAVAVEVDPSMSEDCLIYTTIGTDSTWVAYGRMPAISR